MRIALCLLAAFFLACDDAGPAQTPPPDPGPAPDIGFDIDARVESDAAPQPDAMADAAPQPDAMADAAPQPDAMADAAPQPDAAISDASPIDPDAALPPNDGCGALVILEERCAQGGCHLPNNRRTSLVLTRSAMQSGALNGYVAAGDPEASYLLERMHGRGEGPLMPLGSIAPIPEIEQIEAWIADGASTRCAEPSLNTASDPNHLDADALFVCGGADAPATPARIRRVERREWTRAVVKPLNGTNWGSTAKDNPFAAPERLPYSTWPSDVSIDPATLDLYMLVLPEAPALWTTHDPVRAAGEAAIGFRTEIVYRNPTLRCMFNDAAPDDACIDHYVDTMLLHGVLFRTPTAGEHARFRAFLVQALADEAAPNDRRATLQYAGEAAFLMTGAVFRSELGAPDPADPTRRRLTPDEMALALGHVLNAYPVGAPVRVDNGGAPLGDRTDAEQPALGRLSLLRQAADEGTIFDAETIGALLEAYRGGVDFDRPDLLDEFREGRRSRRGEYWLAENILQFFREWLAYESAITEFKDVPGATSRFLPSGRPMYDRTTVGFENLQSIYKGHESSLVAQLDDTIARAVIESHEQGEDVFEKLLTTRMWRLPSNMADLSEIPCASTDDCCPGGVAGCSQREEYPSCTPRGVCGTSIANVVIYGPRVYNVDIDADVPATPAGRWVQMPADERGGVLTHPAWLSAHGSNFEDDASAVLRGRWVREQMFCETVPGLELVQAEAKLVPAAPTLSARERLHRSVEDPDRNPHAQVCMGCHSQMNSLGLPFESYNHAGFVREFDHGPDGEVPPSGLSRIAEAPEPALDIEVDNAIEFSAAIAQSQVARRCFVRQAFRYFAGRAETQADACVLAEMETALDRSGSFFDMLEVLVTSETFMLREAP